ncbi:MAG: tetratricopeptide repeat domain containing protein [Xanthobacteraceae bacterium]|nr:tetratricopeptide repeat domain containing protein [Xanthobacteraceae bacterium]
MGRKIIAQTFRIYLRLNDEIRASYMQVISMIDELLSLLMFWLRKVTWLIHGRPRLSRSDTPTSNDRTVRLFVSSTFQDMQEERYTLQNDVFPIVQRFLWERGITFIDVDLRWGVTREEAERGDVLGICLREIDRCRPWVLGLLGARYGWVDPEAHSRLRADPAFARLVGHANVSLTELELRHAITDRPPAGPESAALIYWRVAPTLDTPFKALVADIEATGAEIRPPAQDLETFAQVLRNDLLAAVEARIPPGLALPSAQLLARLQIEAERDSFAERPETHRLYRLASGRAGRFALVGPPGCGKSAVMCAAARAIELEGRIKLAAAFAPGGFRNWMGAFKSVLAQLGDQGGATAGPAGRAQRFHLAAGAAAALAPLCVLIDDVETDPAGGDDLAWLPDKVPNAVIIVALRGGYREAALAQAQGYKIINLGPPDPRLAREMIERRLLLYARRLDDWQLGLLVTDRRSARDYLIVSEELRQTQRFEDLDTAVGELAALTRPEALADRALARITCGRPWADEVLLALAVTEVGLADETLGQIAQANGARGALVDIRLLREAIGDYATEAAGRTLLVNPAFRDAILVDRTALDQVRVRKIIIAACIAKIETPGSAEEILTQAAAINDSEEFAALIARPDIAEALMRRAREALAAAWSELSAHGYSADRVFATWVGVQSAGRVALAAEFLVAHGALPTSRRLADDALLRASEDDIQTRVRAHLVCARVAETAGHLQEAKQHCIAVAELADGSGAGTVRALAAANALRLDFLRDGAAALEERTSEVRRLATEHPDGRALATITLVEGLAELERGNSTVARKRFNELKRMSLRDDDLAASAAAEAGLARVEFARGRRKSAERRARNVEDIGEVLSDSRLILEGLAIRTAIAIDDVTRFDEARHLIETRRNLAEAANDQIASIEADLDEAILFAGHAGLRDAAQDLAKHAITRAGTLGLQRLEKKIVHLLAGS